MRRKITKKGEKEGAKSVSRQVIQKKRDEKEKDQEKAGKEKTKKRALGGEEKGEGQPQNTLPVGESKRNEIEGGVQ